MATQAILGLRATTRAAVVAPQHSVYAVRVLNVAVALLLLVLVLPVILVVTILILVTSGRPILYSQIRVGLDRRRDGTRSLYDRRHNDCGGRLFRIYKFRTMCKNAEPDGEPLWAIPNDKRVTRIGGFLRRTRLDELPQLYNVLRGDMNIVGPRPERPTIFATLCQTLPDYALRQRVMPGITGLAQVSQGYDQTVDDVRRKVDFDLEYVEHQSTIEDLRIMAMTVPVVLFRRGGW